MIAPNKVVTLSDSALGMSGVILEQGPHPISLAGLYSRVRDQFESLDQFILALDVLFVLGRVHVDFDMRMVIYAS